MYRQAFYSPNDKLINYSKYRKSTDSKKTNNRRHTHYNVGLLDERIKRKKLKSIEQQCLSIKGEPPANAYLAMFVSPFFATMTLIYELDPNVVVV